MNFRVLHDVRVPMRDGTGLSTDIWIPDGPASPALLVRIPYGKDRIVGGDYGYPLNPDVLELLRAGYAVAWQDCRGRFRSDGDFLPMLDEPSDGADAIEWVARQPWCDGNVGTYGASYLGFTQLASPSQDPPSLKAIAPAATSSDYYTAPWYSPGGALSWHLVQFWPTMIAATNAQRALADGNGDREVFAELMARMVDPKAHLAVPRECAGIAEHAPWWREWLRHPSRDRFWQDLSIVDQAEKMSVPALHVVGWFDLMVGATVRTYREFRARAATADARNGQRLVIGPWDHMSFDAAYPDRQFPMDAGALYSNLTQTYIDFYDRWLRGRDSDTGAPVRIFVMGIDQWRDEEAWPLPGTEYVDYYLSSRKGANTEDGDGLLTTAPPRAGGSDLFVYDPADPVPTLGGRMLLHAAANGSGPADQRRVEARPDVLCFTSAELAEPLEVTGHVALTLYAHSSAVDTDFTAKLVDACPDGRALYLTDGIVRARYRESLAKPRLLDPGTTYELFIDMSVTSNVFLPGHRIRLEVSSSNFLRYDRNTNTGGAIADEVLADATTATNTVLFGPAHRTRLTLPVIRR